jgi:hypothetical protein
MKNSLQTWLQQNLRISTNHKYRIYIGFLKPDVLKPDVLKPDVLEPDVLWVYLQEAAVAYSPIAFLTNVSTNLEPVKPIALF